jgi:hypothetical protein
VVKASNGTRTITVVVSNGRVDSSQPRACRQRSASASARSCGSVRVSSITGPTADASMVAPLRPASAPPEPPPALSPALSPAAIS